MRSKGNFKRAAEIPLEQLEIQNMEEAQLHALAFNSATQHLTHEFMDFLKRNELLPKSPFCNVHEVTARLSKRNDLEDGWVYRCPKYQKENKCNLSNYSIRKRSIFSGSKLHPADALTLMIKFLRLNRLNEIQQESKVAKGTALYYGDLCLRIQSVWTEHYYANFYHKSVFQLDESMHGRKWKYHRGNNDKGIKVWIFGLTDVLSKDLALYIVPDRTKETLEKIIRAHCAPGSWIFSDMWKAYSGLDKLGYVHHMVNHSQEFAVVKFDENSGEPVVVNTNTIEGVWTHTKQYLKHRFGVNRERMNNYLPGMVFNRVNRTFAKRADEFWKTVKQLYPLDVDPLVPEKTRPLSVEHILKLREDMGLKDASITPGFERFADMNLVSIEVLRKRGVNPLLALENGPEYYQLVENIGCQQFTLEIELLDLPENIFTFSKAALTYFDV